MVEIASDRPLFKTIMVESVASAECSSDLYRVYLV
jgi:hypothetical protein